MGRFSGKTAFVIISIFFVSGCFPFPPAPSPSELSRADNSVRNLEAEMIANRIVREKQSAKEPAKKIAPDTAWASIKQGKLNISKPLALAELVDIAISNNPATRWSWQNTQLAVAVEKQAESALYPSLDLSATATREKTTANQPSYDVNELEYGPAFKITYLLFDFGGR